MDSDNRAGGLLSKMFSSAIDMISSGEKEEGRRNKGLIIFALALMALLLVVGTEPMKVLLRRRIGKFALSIGSIILASIIYGVCAFYLFTISSKDDFAIGLNQPLCLAGGAFYGLLAVGTLICGLIEYFKGLDLLDDYRGDSVIFGFLLNKGVSQKVIWTVIEPFSCLVIGGLLTLLHPFIGIPLLVTSVSFMFNEWYNVSRKPIMQRDKIAKMQVVSRQMNNATSAKEEFHKITD